MLGFVRYRYCFLCVDSVVALGGVDTYALFLDVRIWPFYYYYPLSFYIALYYYLLLLCPTAIL